MKCMFVTEKKSTLKLIIFHRQNVLNYFIPLTPKQLANYCIFHALDIFLTL